MPHERLLRVLNYVWLLAVLPAAVACVAGSVGHSLALGVKTFLLLEFVLAVLTPLLGAVIGQSSDEGSRRKKH
jgi:hypothetical protein